MLKKIITIILLFITLITYCQVGIGTSSPNASSILDIKSTTQGILVPRISLINTSTFTLTGSTTTALQFDANSILVYNTSTQNDVTPGFYSWLQTSSTVQGKWVRMMNNTDATLSKIFYMPSITLDVSTLATGKTVDLYSAYLSQFGTPKVVSTGAPAKIPTYTKDQLYYYVTYFDPLVFSVTSIDANGLMTYNVIGSATTASYMNIVFVVK